jgi:ribosomal protein S18 acetylase RimI-like enzyme
VNRGVRHPLIHHDMALRQATTADAEFIYRLVEATMRSYVEQIWGSFSEEYNRRNIAETIAAKSYSIIEYQGENVGAISIERHPDFTQLTQLFILPSRQNRGIGTTLVRELARESRQSGKPVRLRVLRTNPARRLYEREGFQVSSETPERVYMELHA